MKVLSYFATGLINLEQQIKTEAFAHYTKHLKYASLKDKKRLSIASLHYWAKQINLTAYQQRFFRPPEIQPKYLNEDIEKVLETSTEYALAVYFKQLYGDKYICVDEKQKMFYKFNEKCLWVDDHAGASIRNLFSTDFNKIFVDYTTANNVLLDECNNEEQEAYYKKKGKLLRELTIKLCKTNDKNNILREFMDLIIDTEFANDMNKEKHVLPIKNNKMLNLKTLETYERTIKNKFNYECDANYINLSEEDELDIKQYFLDLFCGKDDMVQCVMVILKSIFTGETLRYIYSFTGAGCNGKSLLFKLLQQMFNKSMDSIDTSVILDKK